MVGTVAEENVRVKIFGRIKRMSLSDRGAQVGDVTAAKNADGCALMYCVGVFGVTMISLRRSKRQTCAEPKSARLCVTLALHYQHHFRKGVHPFREEPR